MGGGARQRSDALSDRALSSGTVDTKIPAGLRPRCLIRHSLQNRHSKTRYASFLQPVMSYMSGLRSGEGLLFCPSWSAHR